MTSKKKPSGQPPKVSLEKNWKFLFDYSLNTILYGPPGTGKTYYTTNLAVGIIENLSENEVIQKYPEDQRESLKKQYDQYKEEGNIAFVTFHQAFSYEDFVEGIKPVPHETGSLFYTIEDGIFKQLCIKATYALYMARQQRLEKNKQAVVHDFDALYREFVDFLLRMLPDEEAKEFVFETVTQRPLQLEQIGQHQSLIFRHEQGRRVYSVTKNRLEKLYNRFESIDEIHNVTQDIIDTIGSSNTAVYWAVFNRLKEFEVQRSQAHQYIFEKENPSPDDPYELMKKTVMGFDFSKLSAEDWQMAERYVLVIDEINRGNIAGIFGELITLIEEDKRAGKPEALSVILPYSKQPFVIPSNLYIIGTMNTADRNVEALDTALRRRFTFVRVPPHPELLQPANFLLNVLRKQQYALEKNDEINVKETKAVYGFVGVHPEKQKTLQEVMEKKEEINLEKILKNVDFTGIDLERMLRIINNRIEKLLDADHCIGHAYFMGVMDTDHPLKALEKVFYQKLIPLLQEYFYGDDEKIALIIGKSFFEPTPSYTNDFFADTDTDVEWLDDVVNRKIYHIKPLAGKAFRNAVIRIYAIPSSR